MLSLRLITTLYQEGGDLVYTAYLITNKFNNMKYVGITCRNPEKRFREHIVKAHNGSHALLHSAIREFGESAFQLSILETDIPDNAHEERERFYIDKYNTYYVTGNGYNQTIGGNGTVGYMFTSTDKQKISDALTGRTYSDERNAKIRNAMLNREYKQEWRDHLSKSRLGRFCGSKNSFYGKTHTDATKQKISESNTKHSVLQFDPKSHMLLNTFKNLSYAADWVISEGLTKAKKSTCTTRIHVVCTYDDMKHKAYGFIWRFGEKSID